MKNLNNLSTQVAAVLVSLFFLFAFVAAIGLFKNPNSLLKLNCDLNEGCSLLWDGNQKEALNGVQSEKDQAVQK